MKGNAVDWLALFVSPLNYKAKSLLTIVNNKGKVVGCSYLMFVSEAVPLSTIM